MCFSVALSANRLVVLSPCREFSGLCIKKTTFKKHTNVRAKVTSNKQEIMVIILSSGIPNLTSCHSGETLSGVPACWDVSQQQNPWGGGWERVWVPPGAIRGCSTEVEVEGTVVALAVSRRRLRRVFVSPAVAAGST